jgi:scyllo-inositol 2-dehydrogenase (NADP+)
MKIHITSKAEFETENLINKFFARVGFDLADIDPDVEAQYLLAGESVVSTKSSVPKLIFGPGVFEFLKDLPGVEIEDLTPVHEIRLRPNLHNSSHNEDIYLTDQLAILKISKDYEIAATANYHLKDFPMAIYFKKLNMFVLNISNSENFRSDRLARFTKVWLSETLEKKQQTPLKVGLLAYGAIGHEHNRAVSNVGGFELVAVCDSNPARIEVAKSLAGSIEGYEDANQLLDSEIDLVVISTPPNSHFTWAKQALEKNKHVVLEKPMALTVSECDELIKVAEEKNKTLVVYQNRRWDPDFLTIRKILDEDKIGEVFHAEIFVGGYGHPCNYWHSDEAVSGGAIFDWGSHFLDQALSLFGKEIKFVTANEHKVNWLDVTNSDHARITLTYQNGLEVEFIHSDLAAALKPKYYLLGTKGAIVGEWREEKVVARNEIGTLSEDRFAPADSPASIKLFDKNGSVTWVKPEQALAFQFHRELEDWIFQGIPMTVNAESSRNVVAVMQAAARSAAAGGLPVSPLL